MYYVLIILLICSVHCKLSTWSLVQYVPVISKKVYYNNRFILGRFSWSLTWFTWRNREPRDTRWYCSSYRVPAVTNYQQIENYFKFENNIREANIAVAAIANAGAKQLVLFNEWRWMRWFYNTAVSYYNFYFTITFMICGKSALILKFKRSSIT